MSRVPDDMTPEEELRSLDDGPRPAGMPAPSYRERRRCREALSSAVGMYLALPRKLQVLLVTLAAVALGRATGVDAAVVRSLIGPERAVERPSDEELEAERRDQR